MGLFPDENINWYQKLAVMIRNRLLASAGQLLPLWRAWPISLGLPCPPALWVCSTSSFVDLLPTALQGKSKSSARLKKKYRYIYSKKTPRKNCSKLGVARDCHAQHCRDGDWLTEAPVFQNGGGSGSWHKSTRDPYFPRGESPPRHNPPLSPSGVGAGVHRTHQEALTVFVVICEITSISMLLPGTHPPFKNESSASRKDTLLHLILSLYSQASATKWILYQGYILL